MKRTITFQNHTDEVIDVLSLDLVTMKVAMGHLGYWFETSADGMVERMYRPDGTLALTATLTVNRDDAS